MNWSASDVIQALSLDAARVPAFPRDFVATGVSIDSRTVKRGELFVCLRGENHDGHEYASQAVGKGAAAVIAEAGRSLDAHQTANTAGTDPDRKAGAMAVPVLLVEDTLSALQSLGRTARNRLTGSVIAVTGSSGKTSAKEMLLGMGRELFGTGAVYATEGNLNNHIGLPLSLCRVPTGAEKLVILELGMNHAGEISLLSGIARPHAALITSISGAHMEFFQSVDEIAGAKLEVIDGMDPGSVLVFPEDAPGAAIARTLCTQGRVRPVTFLLGATESTADSSGVSFSFAGEIIKNHNYFAPVMASNLVGCLTVLRESGLMPGSARTAARAARPLTGRRFQVMQRTTTAGKARFLIDDSYNANPDSFCRAIETLRSLLPEGRLALVAGEMAELGPDAAGGHREVGRKAGEMRVDWLVASGGSNADILVEGFLEKSPHGRVIRAATAVETARLVDRHAALAECDGILVKGSRSARMDIVADALRNQGYV